MFCGPYLIPIYNVICTLRGVRMEKSEFIMCHFECAGEMVLDLEATGCIVWVFDCVCVRLCMCIHS